MIDTVLPLAAYRAHRVSLRRESIAHRRGRTVQLGPAMRVQFEDLHSVRHQVHEVLHAERCSDPAAVRRTIDDFAHLLPHRIEARVGRFLYHDQFHWLFTQSWIR